MPPGISIPFGRTLKLLAICDCMNEVNFCFSGWLSTKKLKSPSRQSILKESVDALGPIKETQPIIFDSNLGIQT
tara:strand:- start:339 stop:560 length:222 start_codon:yes stop_codon:yes gene_type:complete